MAGSMLDIPCVTLGGEHKKLGDFPGKALLVVNGGAPRGVGAGESHQGVKVLSVGKEEAVVEKK